jgi:hypothetical protein
VTEIHLTGAKPSHSQVQNRHIGRWGACGRISRGRFAFSVEFGLENEAKDTEKLIHSEKTAGDENAAVSSRTPSPAQAENVPRNVLRRAASAGTRSETLPRWLVGVRLAVVVAQAQ